MPAEPSTTTPSKLKLVAFSLATMVLAVAILEVISAKLEPQLFPYRRTLPIAAPGEVEGLESFESRAEAARTAAASEGESISIPMVADKARGWALAPGESVDMGGVAIRVNPMGMRGPDLDIVKGDIRLMTLGDSSIFGFGVQNEEVFSSIAAWALGKKWGRTVIGINSAVPGHDSGQSLSTLKHYGPQLTPTWVVIGNIWSDVYHYDAELGSQEVMYVPPAEGVLKGSALYRLLWRAIRPTVVAQQVQWIQGRQDIGEDVNYTRVPLGQYIQNLMTMADEAKKVGARVAFVTLPAPMDFDEVPVPDTVARYRYAMAQAAEILDAPLLDGPKFFKENGGHIGHFQDQAHPTRDGHKLLGAGLAEKLPHLPGQCGLGSIQ